jgi:hypothetical protein
MIPNGHLRVVPGMPPALSPLSGGNQDSTAAAVPTCENRALRKSEDVATFGEPKIGKGAKNRPPVICNLARGRLGQRDGQGSAQGSLA